MNYKVADFRDILKDPYAWTFIVHGCNNKGGFGSGIAKIVLEEYPECKERYLTGIKSEMYQLGDIIWYSMKPGHHIGNMLTQSNYGYDGKKYASYDAIDQAFENLSLRLDEVSNSNVAFPMIGAGLGGLNWFAVSEIIDYRLRGKDYTCVVRPQDIKKHNLCLPKKSQ